VIESNLEQAQRRYLVEALGSCGSPSAGINTSWRLVLV